MPAGDGGCDVGKQGQGEVRRYVVLGLLGFTALTHGGSEYPICLGSLIQQTIIYKGMGFRKASQTSGKGSSWSDCR